MTTRETKMDKLILCDADEKDIELINNSKVVNKLEKIFKAVGTPADKVRELTMEQYKEKLEKKAKDVEKWVIQYKNKKKGVTTSDAELKEIEDKQFVIETILVSSGIKVVYCYIDAYTEKPETIKVTRPDPLLPLTNVELLAIYTRAFQFIYEEEESEVGNPGHIEGMQNRDQSHGRYGVWGHDLSDLVYNGDSAVSIYKDFVYCEFAVDS